VAHPAAARQAKQERKKNLERQNLIRVAISERKEKDAFIEENLPAVKNPHGRARGYEEVRMFLTVFCSVYLERAEALDDPCVPHPLLPQFMLQLPDLPHAPQGGSRADQRLHPLRCCARAHGRREC
jgi:hypothetical protein